MAYNPLVAVPQCLTLGGVGAPLPNSYFYISADTAATVAAAGYFTDAKSRGMRVGDLVYVQNTTASPNITTIHRVQTVNAVTGVSDLTDGVVLATANSG